MDADERELRAGFAEWRALERSGAPTFEALLESEGEGPGALAPRTRRRWHRPALGGALAAAAACAALWAHAEREQRRFEAVLEQAVSEAGLGEWTAASDFLLDVPGLEYYASVPSIINGWEGRDAPPGAAVSPDSQGRKP